MIIKSQLKSSYKKYIIINFFSFIHKKYYTKRLIKQKKYNQYFSISKTRQN